MKRVLKSLLLGILAGLAIGLGGSLFLVCKQYNLPILGGFLFPIGLLLVCVFGLFLFTGKIGYIFKEKKSYGIDLALMYVGNLIGALMIGYLIRLLFINNDLLDTASVVTNGKLVDLGDGGKPWYTMLLSSVGCGVLVFIAVNTFKKDNLPMFLRVIILFATIAAFVILGFDHCIANMFYYAVTNTYISSDIGRVILSLFIVTIGNSIGAIITYFVSFGISKK